MSIYKDLSLSTISYVPTANVTPKNGKIEKNKELPLHRFVVQCKVSEEN